MHLLVVEYSLFVAKRAFGHFGPTKGGLGENTIPTFKKDPPEFARISI